MNFGNGHAWYAWWQRHKICHCITNVVIVSGGPACSVRNVVWSLLLWTGHQLTPVPEDSTCTVADGDRHNSRCQGNGVAVAVNGSGCGTVARSRSLTTPRPPPVAKRSCLRQATDSRAAVPPVAVADVELPRSPRRVDLQRLPARLRVTGENPALPATDQASNDNNNHDGNNDDTAVTTTTPVNYELNVDPTLYPSLGVRLTTV